MPQGETFWNPYRMIPIRERIEKEPPAADERFRGVNGHLSCSLENLTPLFVGAKEQSMYRSFQTRNGRPVIPGSSLKGMLRSLTEVVGGGCAVTDAGGQHSRAHAACDTSTNLCVGCRMFGMLERGRRAKVHMGKVRIGDAVLETERPETKQFQILLSGPATRHKSFYITPETGRPDGKARKFYFHQPKRTESVPTIPEQIRSRAWFVNALTPGHRFAFDVQFSNLTEHELSLLLYALSLEESVEVKIEEAKLELRGSMRHKVGNAKSLGFGSCRIRVEKAAFLQEAGQRYASLASKKDRVLEGDALGREIADKIRPWVEDKSPTMKQLRKMMIWAPDDPREFRYPDYPWFQNSANSQKELKRI